MTGKHDQALLRRAIWALAVSILLATAMEIYGLYSFVDAIVNSVQEEEDTDISVQLRELFERADYAKLIAVAEERETTHPNDTNVHYYLGRMHYAQGNLEAARARFERVLSISPDWEESVADFMSAPNNE